MVLELKDALGILIAALGGAAVGLEREWSGHASGPGARFAGIRTFTLLGLQAGLAGWLWSNGLHAIAALLLAGCAALIVAAYIAASRVDVDGTTEVAAFVVLAAGVVAGLHELRLASATIAITTLLLVEKSRLHRLVERIDDASLRAGFRFAVMAVVILPILPSGPYGPLGGIRLRQLWAMVLFFSGLSFAGYLARRSMGPQKAYPTTGMLGGIVSSTNVTLSFARASRSEIDAGTPLELGVLAASAVMCVRVLVATAVLNFPVSAALVPYLVAPFLAAALIAWWGLRKHQDAASVAEVPSNPLQFTSALQNGSLVSGGTVYRPLGTRHMGRNRHLLVCWYSWLDRCGCSRRFDGQGYERAIADRHRGASHCNWDPRQHAPEVIDRSSHRSKTVSPHCVGWFACRCPGLRSITRMAKVKRSPSTAFLVAERLSGNLRESPSYPRYFPL